MNNKLAVAASLLVALVFTVVLLLSAGGKGGKTENPVKPEKTDTPEQTVSAPVSENPEHTAKPQPEKPVSADTAAKPEKTHAKSGSAAVSVLGYAFGEVVPCVTDIPAEKVPVQTVSFIACAFLWRETVSVEQNHSNPPSRARIAVSRSRRSKHTAQRAPPSGALSSPLTAALNAAPS